jgi:hypothetical protein
LGQVGAIGMTWKHALTNVHSESTPLTDVCFGRYIDPDQGQPHGMGYETVNAVISQAGRVWGDDLTGDGMVTAISATSVGGGATPLALVLASKETDVSEPRADFRCAAARPTRAPYAQCGHRPNPTPHTHSPAHPTATHVTLRADLASM